MGSKKIRRRRGLTFDDVREIALAMPDVVETTAYGMPAFKVGKRLFAVQPIARPDVERNSLGVHIGFDQRDRLIAERPDVYYVTDHFNGYPAVLVRLSNLDRAELSELLGEAWRLAMEGATRAKRKRRTISGLRRVGRD